MRCVAAWVCNHSLPAGRHGASDADVVSTQHQELASKFSTFAQICEVAKVFMQDGVGRDGWGGGEGEVLFRSRGMVWWEGSVLLHAGRGLVTWE